MATLSLNGERNPRKRRNSEPPEISTAKRLKLVQESILLQNIKDTASGPIDSWIQTGKWPTGYAMEPPVNPVHGLKRTSSGTSASRRSSQRPTERINILAQNGVEIEHDENIYKTTENNDLWAAVQPAEVQEQLLPFPTSNLMAALQQASSRNEQRLQRDVLPLIIPSPAWINLHQHTTLEARHPDQIIPDHLCEELSAEWIKCKKTFGDTKPRPDFAVGWSHSAFSPDEQKSVLLNQDLDFPSQYTPEMWFPFLICEIKSRDRPFLEAKRQAINAGALAACALVHLYQAAYLHSDAQKIRDLSGGILAFCVIMNDDQAELWGIYPGITINYGGLQVKYRRRVLQRLNYEAEGREGLTKFYNIVYGIYKVFGPQQLRMVKAGLAALPERDANALSFTAASNLQQGDELSTEAPPGPFYDHIRQLMQKIEQQNVAREAERKELQEQLKQSEARHQEERASDRADRQLLLDTIANLAGNAKEK